ncbi:MULTISPECIES: hypothetical protein [unclassified Caballeronia]|uniref:hypothetical protein n=1 Tax=unclassified Caballeronia TaxID=2646786 RepID=UPI0028631998|nr:MULTISPECIES: hypothetical protein [unclassified Caballeronia]MDR5821610.1 hypothetical protein [Caballeronia sp. LZ043]MDR5879832.1 hypothetical protein [Caballeronia sp. LZ032]
MTSGQHPARPGGLSLTFGLLLAPFAWMTQTTLGQTLSAWGCFPHQRPVHAPALPWLEQGLAMTALGALVIGGAGGVIAWRNWRRTGKLASELKQQGSIDRHAARDAFIARAGALASALFVFALIATDLAWLLVSPCGGR